MYQIKGQKLHKPQATHTEISNKGFSSMYYQYKYMEDHLHQECNFWASVFFKDIPDDFLKCKISRYPWDSNEFSPKYTGIPPHTILICKNGNHENKFLWNEVKYKQ